MASVRRRETWILLVGDLILLVASLWIALFLRAFTPPSTAYFYAHLELFVVVFAMSLLVFFIAGLYERHVRLIKTAIVMRAFGAQMANTIMASVLFFILPGPLEPKTILGLYLVVSVTLISLWRFFIVPHISTGTRDKAVLAGTGAEVQELMEELKSGAHRYYVEIVSFIDTQTITATEIETRIEKAIHEGATMVVVDKTVWKEGMSRLYSALGRGVLLVDFSTLFGDVFDRVPLDHINDAWLIENLPRQRFVYDLAKVVFDRIAAAIGFLISLAIVIPVAVLLAVMGGTPFISHERIGKGGRRFRIFKLRTMLFDDKGEAEAQARNRVTAFGRFLRRSRIDELPQLLNVLMGDLSFVGPRPELPAIAAVYEREIPYYAARHLVTPGLSGWAQIWDQDPPKGPADVVRTRRKLSFDLYYLQHRSLILDMAITLKTLRAFLSFSGT